MKAERFSWYSFALFAMAGGALLAAHGDTQARTRSVAEIQDGSLLLRFYHRIFQDKTGSAAWPDKLAGKHDADFKQQNKAVAHFDSTRSIIWGVVTLYLTPSPQRGEGSQEASIPNKSGSPPLHMMERGAGR